MGKIVVTRIACLGLAANIFRETIYGEKPRNLWGETLFEIHFQKCSSSTNHPCIHLRNGEIPLEVVHNFRTDFPKIV